jgi:predicted nucleic acid-binding protein
MPVADSFVDTNILLYAVSTEASETRKATVARSLLTTADWAWSAQVAAEFVNASTSARRPTPLTLAQASRWIDTWMGFPMIAVDEGIVRQAIRLAKTTTACE